MSTWLTKNIFRVMINLVDDIVGVIKCLILEIWLSIPHVVIKLFKGI